MNSRAGAPPLLAAVLDALPDAVLLLDESGRVMAVNRRAETMLGYPREELVDGGADRLSSAGLSVWALTGRAPGEPGPSVEVAVRHRDGHDLAVQVTATETQLDGARVVVATLRREAGETVQRLASVVESSSDAILTTNLNGTLTSWNRGAELVYGYSAAEAVGRPVTLIMGERYAHEMADVLAQIRSGRRVETFEAVRYRKDGTAIDVSISVSPLRDSSGVIVGASTVARDITELKRTGERVRALLESAPDAVVVVGRQGQMEFVNRQVEELFGYDREQLLGSGVEMLLPERLRDIADYRVGYFASPETRQTGAALELSGLHADGSEFPIEVMFSPLELDDGVAVYIAIRDITARKLTEEELRRSNHDLEQFAYVASHDLSEPLRVIAGFVDLLARRYRGQLDEDADRFINFTVAGVERMQTLIDDLLAYSRAGRAHLEVEEVDTDAVVRDVLWSLGPQIEARGVQVHTAALPNIRGEESMLRQIFQNLITNAIKFSDADEPVVRIGAERSGQSWRFDVEDNGPGIESRHAERVFEMFQRLHGREVPGSGIGLAIVQRLTERHGGRVWVSAAAHRGSIFSFTIPDRAPAR